MSYVWFWSPGWPRSKLSTPIFPDLGKRMSPFERTPPWSVYVPPQDKVEVTADSDLELAVLQRAGQRQLPGASDTA